MKLFLPKHVRDYVIALLIISAALAVRWPLYALLGGQRPYLTLFGGVALAVWFARWRAAALAAVVGFFAANYFVARPEGVLDLNTLYFAEAVVYGLSTGLIIFSGEAMHRARERAVREAAERRIAEESERERKELLRVTLASIGDAVISTDADGRITYLNAVAEAVTGWQQSDAVGQPLDAVFRIINEQTRTPVENPAVRALHEGVIVGLANHTVLVTKDGTQRPIDDSAAPIRDEKGGIVGCVLVFRDIAQRRKEEQELRRAEERTRSVVDNVLDAIITIDERGVMQTFNAAAERLFGYSPSEAIGQNVNLLMPEPYHREHDSYLANYLRTGQAQIIGIGREVVGRRKDGSTFPMDLAVSEFSLAGSRHFTGIVRDITERKQSEATIKALNAQLAAELVESKHAEGAVRLSKERYRMSLIGSPVAVWECDRELRFTFVDNSQLPVTDPALIVGKRDDEILPLESVREIIGIKQHVLATGRGERREICVSYGGARYYFEYVCEPMCNTQGEITGLRGLAIDITQRKAIERERDERAAELAVALHKRTEEARRAENAEWELHEADRRKDEFLAMLAHELRNPLAPVRNAIQIMRLARDDPAAVEQALATMERQSGQMVRLVDDLLDVARISQGRIELRKECAELASVIYQAVEICRPLAESMQHEVNVSLPEQPLYLFADSVRMAQVFSNLLNNACKYTPPGGRIWLAAQRQGSDVMVCVKDSGIGISRELLPQVFEMFTQLDTSLERTRGGLGIGLTLVKQLVEMHDGTVEAKSEGRGLGSEFVVRLPIIVENQPQSSVKPAIKQAVAGRRILVVDDNTDSAASLAMLLKLIGHETRVAHDGLEAVVAAEDFRPQFVLLDIGLPRLNGFDACRQIREQTWGKTMTLVALTGWGQDEDRRKSLDAGFNHHLVKPVDYVTLMKVLGEMEATQV